MEGLKSPTPSPTHSPTESPLKRKTDPVAAKEAEDEIKLKQQKLDAPVEESADAIQDDKKGKSVQSPADKGKGKLLVHKEKDIGDEGVREPGDYYSSGEEGSAEAEGEETDLTDEPLSEMDLDNILPERTRTSAKIVPGTYSLKADDDGDKEVEVGDEDYQEDLEEYEEQEEEAE